MSTIQSLKAYVFVEDVPEKQRWLQLDDLLDSVSCIHLIRTILTSCQSKVAVNRIAIYQVESLAIPASPKDTCQDRVEAWLMEHLEEELELRGSVIGDFWPNGGDWTRGQNGRGLDLVIVDEAGLEGLKVTHDLPDLATRADLVKANNELVKTFQKAPSPSEGSSVPKRCYKGPVAVCSGRPIGFYGPSNSLFDGNLAIFTHEIRNLRIVDIDDRLLETALSLIRTSAEFYDSELLRETALKPYLLDLFPGGKWQASIKGARSEAFWLPYAVFELKNESGTSGDPEPQAVLDYIKILADPDMSRDWSSRSNCPAVLLSIAGTRFSISTVISTDAVYVEDVYSINLHGSFDLADKVLDFARALRSLKDVFTRLQVFYHSLDNTSVRSDGSHLVPRPVEDNESYDGVLERLGLRLIRKMSRGGPNVTHDDADGREMNRNYAIYLGLGSGAFEMKENEEVVVKFARRYNVTAHELLAKEGLAPRVYYQCPVLHGYTMVVMDKVNGDMAWDYVHGHKMKVTGGILRATPIPSSVYEDVKRAIDILHNENIVFGDLRLPNIMIRQDDQGLHGILVDFDWAGNAGEARYPATLIDGPYNEWPEGVKKYGHMEKEHDLRLLEQLNQACERVAAV